MKPQTLYIDHDEMIFLRANAEQMIFPFSRLFHTVQDMEAQLLSENAGEGGFAGALLGTCTFLKGSIEHTADSCERRLATVIIELDKHLARYETIKVSTLTFDEYDSYLLLTRDVARTLRSVTEQVEKVRNLYNRRKR